MNLRYLNVYPEQARGLPEAVTSRPELHFDARKDFNETNATNDHIKNFIDAIAHGAELNCPAQTWPRGRRDGTSRHHVLAEEQEGLLEPGPRHLSLRVGRVRPLAAPGTSSGWSRPVAERWPGPVPR